MYSYRFACDLPVPSGAGPFDLPWALSARHTDPGWYRRSAIQMRAAAACATQIQAGIGARHTDAGGRCVRHTDMVATQL